MQSLSCDFVASNRAPEYARRFVQTALESLEATAVAGIAVLLTNELVCNVVRHARSAGTIVVYGYPPLRVEVRDQRPDRACPVAPIEHVPFAEHGLGLFLVDQLARRWGCDLEPSEKVVWFEL
jgi:anti-sigma regulatory factor (Ser/Thr protein kinase)